MKKISMQEAIPRETCFRYEGKQPSAANWKKFQAARTIPEKEKTIACYAAFNHMRITRLGLMMPCCFSTLKNQLWSKERGIKYYWFEGLNVEYQDAFLETKLHDGCDTCKERIEEGITPPIVDYDWNNENRLESAMSVSYPKVFEFEISNLCNMECPMCVGYLSSKHAMNRDKHIDWGVNIFDDDDNLNHLVEEIKEFIPHLEEMRFVGGEPLAHKAMYKIAKVVREIKPELRIQVCTNGSIFNKQVKEICEKNNMKFSFSLDTIIPEEYKTIRVGGKYNETYSNVKEIANIIGAENITINATLMSVNCRNIVKLIEYAYENKFDFFLNTYGKHGRITSPDWGLDTVDEKTINDLTDDCMTFLENHNGANMYDTGYTMQVKKVLLLVKNVEYIPSVPWSEFKDAK